MPGCDAIDLTLDSSSDEEPLPRAGRSAPAAAPSSSQPPAIAAPSLPSRASVPPPASNSPVAIAAPSGSQPGPSSGASLKRAREEDVVASWDDIDAFLAERGMLADSQQEPGSRRPAAARPAAKAAAAVPEHRTASQAVTQPSSSRLPSGGGDLPPAMAPAAGGSALGGTSLQAAGSGLHASGHTATTKGTFFIMFVSYLHMKNALQAFHQRNSLTGAQRCRPASKPIFPTHCPLCRHLS